MSFFASSFLHGKKSSLGVLGVLAVTSGRSFELVSMSHMTHEVCIRGNVHYNVQRKLEKGRSDMYISVAETRGRLADLLKNLEQGPVTITRRGHPVGVLVEPETYERLRRVEAYLAMLKTFREPERARCHGIRDIRSLSHRVGCAAVIVIDASALLCGFLPDEAQPGAQALIRDHALGRLALCAPTLLSYEVTNAVLVAERRGRISREEAGQIVDAVVRLGIEEDAVGADAMLRFAHEYGRSAYDAAYLALASANGEELITGDRRLFNAVRDRLAWVRWVGDWGA